MTGLVGARLTFVLQNPGAVSSFGDLFDLRGGGLVFYGAFLVGIPVGFAVMYLYALPAFQVWDLLGTAFPLSHAISRVGCWAAGCCYGAPTDAAPVVYTAGQVLAEWRAAERRLDAIPEGTAEWRAVRRDIDHFRSRYQAMFKR